MENKTFKVALYKSMSTGNELVCEYNECSPEGTPQYPRASEVLEISFVPLSDERAVANQLAALDMIENNAVRAYETQLKTIKERRAELLALTYKAP